MDLIVGEVVTAANMNLHVRDNLNYLLTGALVALVSDTTLGAPAASIDIQNIPATYEHLQLIANVRGTAAVVNTVEALVRLNNDSAGNYYHQYLRLANTTYSGGGTAAATSGRLVIYVGGDSAAANIFSPVEALFPDYRSGQHKTWRSAGGFADGTIGNYSYGACMGRWGSVSVVNRLTFLPDSGNWATNSRATLYGLDV